MPSYGWPPYKGGVAHAGGACVWQPQNCTIRGRNSRRCGRGYSWKAASEVGWHRFPAYSAVKRSRAPPPRVRTSPGASACHMGGGVGGGSDPIFSALARHRAGGGGAPEWSHHLPSPFGVAPPTEIAAGRLKGRTRVALLNLALTAAGLQAWFSPWLAPGNRSPGPGNAPSRPSGHACGQTNPSRHRLPPPGSRSHAPGPPRSPLGDGPSSFGECWSRSCFLQMRG